jgi:hypothetical protein
LSSITQATPPRRRFPLVALVPALVPIVVFSKALVGRAAIAPGDALIGSLPGHILVARALRGFHLPGWEPYSFSGMPLLALGGDVFYPPNVLFLVAPAIWANSVLIAFHVALAGVGAFFLARKLTGDEVGAAVAGVGFASCGFIWGQMAHEEIVVSAAWIPWVLFSYLLLRERVTAARLALGAGALALSLLGGHPQIFFLAIAALAVFAASLWVMNRPGGPRAAAIGAGAVALVGAVESGFRATGTTEGMFLVFDLILFVAVGVMLLRRALRRPSPRTKRSLPWIVPAIVLLGCAIAAVQIVPEQSALGQTTRQSIDLATANTFSFSPSHLALLLFPYLFGNNSQVRPFDAPYTGHWNLTELAGYVGLACLVFAAAGLPRIRRDARALALALTAFVFGIVMLGASTGAAELVYLTPVYGHFRSWARYVAIVDLAVAVFAGYGVAHIRAAAAAEKRRAVRRAWLTVGALVVLGLVVPFLPVVSRYRASGATAILSVAVPLTAAVLAAAACVVLTRRRRLGSALCCVLVALDGLLSFGAFYEWRTSPSPAEIKADYSPSTPLSWGTVPQTGGGIVRYLYAGSAVTKALPDLPILTDVKGIRSATGYDPLAPRDYTQAVGNMDYSGLIPDAAPILSKPNSLLDVLRVSLVFLPHEEVPTTIAPGLVAQPTTGEMTRFLHTPAVPDAYLVGEAVPATHEQAISTLSGGKFDLNRAAFVNEGCSACAALRVPGRAGTVTAEHWKEDSLSFSVDARRPALLVVSSAWFPGWSAEVDGRPAPLVRANGLVLGAVVPPGKHDVVFRYRTPGLTAGAAISVLTLAALLGALAVPALRRARTAKRARGPAETRSASA